MRHQCIIYKGAPSEHLKSVAATLVQNLHSNKRCMYLNSPAMVAGMRCAISALSVDLDYEVSRGSLLLTSDQSHLRDGHFDVANMLMLLEAGIDEALARGFAGLWASGDMTWEFGGEIEVAKLVEYEELLEDLFTRRADLSGICQYHESTLPVEAVQAGMTSHKTLYINETLSISNRSYRHAS